MKSEKETKEKIKIDAGLGEKIIFEDGFMRVARSRHRLKVPECFDADLAYLAGYHLGDGYLEDSYKTFKRRGRGCYEITYADSDMQQIKLINAIIRDKFNCELRIFKRPNVNLWLGRIHCKALHWFINKKLEIPIGKRSEIKIPSWIYDEREFLSSFLSGFFDAESDVSRTTATVKGKKYYRIRIQLTQKDKNILLEIKSILKNKFNVNSDVQQKWNQEAYILRIGSTKGAKQFQEGINFRNPIKKRKLEELLVAFGVNKKK